MSDQSQRPGPAGRSARVVAELGRPETAQETADRKAAASAVRRGNQTMFNLVIAVIASLAIVAFLVIVVVRPNQAVDQPKVNYVRTAAQAQPTVSEHLVVPKLPTSWKANRAEFDAGAADGVTTWGIGLLTPKGQYIGLAQGLRAGDEWIADQTNQERATGAAHVAGVTWTVYDERDQPSPGNLAYAMVANLDGSQVVLAGTAVNSEFRELATAVVRDSGGHS